LETRSEAADATLLLKLTAPLDLELQAEVTQKKTWPWRFRLEVPRFDPREELLPSSSFTSLAASLSGHGSPTRCDFRQAGAQRRAAADRAAALHPQGDDVAIDSVLRISRANGGAIHLGGDVNLGREPVTAKVAATWNDIVVPIAWVGQELFTHGKLDVQGSADAYTHRASSRSGRRIASRTSRSTCGARRSESSSRSSTSRSRRDDCRRAAASICSRSWRGT
jgi:translocation and assembly module TamB